MTARHELVVFDSMCLAVRDLQTGAWLDDHSALDERISLDVDVRSSESERVARFQLVVHSFDMRLVVGRVLAVRRPSVETCDHVARLSQHELVAVERLQRSVAA